MCGSLLSRKAVCSVSVMCDSSAGNGLGAWKEIELGVDRHLEQIILV